MPSKVKNLNVTENLSKNKVFSVSLLPKYELPVFSSMPKQQSIFVGETSTAKVPSTGKKHRTVDSYYDECQCKLYLVVFLALVNAFNCGHAISLALVVDPVRILDLHRYQPQQYVLAMALYFIMGNIFGASLASKYFF